jgi:hypothetical protein
LPPEDIHPDIILKKARVTDSNHETLSLVVIGGQTSLSILFQKTEQNFLVNNGATTTTAEHPNSKQLDATKKTPHVAVWCHQNEKTRTTATLKIPHP